MDKEKPVGKEIDQAFGLVLQKQDLPRIDKVTIDESGKELDSELHLIIKNEVDGLVLEETKEVMKKRGARLSQAIITKLNDRANQIGKAYIMKKVLKYKKPLFDSVYKLAQGGIYEEEIVVMDASGNIKNRILKTKQIPPNISAVKYLLNMVDGSRPDVVTVNKREVDNKDIDEVINS